MNRAAVNRVGLAGKITALAVVPLVVSGCGGPGSSGQSGGSSTVVLGASLSLTGALGQFGVDLKAGYQQLVADVNAQGGLGVGGSKRKVSLVVLDNRSDPNTASQQVRELILKDNAAGILGACTPPIVIPEALAAEQQRIPFVSTCNPVGAFAAGNKSGWKYSWDLFFDEKQQAQLVAKGLKLVGSSNKVALFTDTEPDGVVERGLFKKELVAAGLEVVGDYSFPVGTTDFSSFINDAKAKGAGLVAAQMVPPDGIALWKQMKALSFRPAGAYAAKAANGNNWVKSLGPVAEGTLLSEYWSPASGAANSQQLMRSLGVTFAKSDADLAIAVMGYTAANVMTDAITAAGGTDPAKVSSAIGATHKDYPLGPISFSSTTHTAITPLLLDQWQNGKLVEIIPSVPGVALQSPGKGLK
ncbi:ABC transporter substrate-binding protein [Streptomyces sp. So13.3]|uniref:ABC transporter substrate-binding protein n=2 Tax=Streptomyces TaxID=1883 RepID=UPI00164DCFA7|nr:ABC transporter substrate-binding protein [Streptomyces sp. So13.3]QNA76302.1 ABC transporter substrate-binding protein [Streptomyces sp. So13.3]